MPMQPYMLDPEVEAMPMNKLKELQNKRLQNVVIRCYEKMDMYREKFE